MNSLYTREFYEEIQAGSTSSADVIVPILLSIFPAASVVDVGCGNGAWLQAFDGNGVTNYLGVDGAHVPPDMLRIPSERFRAEDLSQLLEIGQRFDIACSLEVAEHLPKECSEQFVKLLARAAPVVLFSAAIPHQTGDGHLNEQWQSYWSNLFIAHDYVAIDCIRPAVYGDPRVDWWYRQNTLVYCDSNNRPAQYLPVSNPWDLNRVDPEMVEMLDGLGGASGNGIRSAMRTIRRDVAALGRALTRKGVSGV
jgi:SAM-dependent methyltransferase